MERRKFIEKTFLASFVLTGAAAMQTSCSKDDDPTIDNNNNNNNNGITIDLTKSEFSTLNMDGGYAYSGNIIIFNSAGSYFALSKICTHEGCTLIFASAQNKLVCGCHGSSFNNSGQVLTGPAVTALKVYTVTKDGNILTIK